MHFFRVAIVECDKDQRRQNNATRSSNPRQHAIGPACKLTIEKLTLDLKPDQQEEDSHQRIIDPMRKTERSDVEMQSVEISL
ncbi:hypothetical protein FQZ97_780340 [compost metagenome]